MELRWRALPAGSAISQNKVLHVCILQGLSKPSHKMAGKRNASLKAT